MFNSAVLNVVIGLMLVYLLYSLLVTTLSELLSSWKGYRKKMLYESIKRMLDGGKANTITNAFYNQPLIKSFTREEGGKPSYLGKENFSKNLVDLLTANAEKNLVNPSAADRVGNAIDKYIPSGDVQKLLKSYWSSADTKLDIFKKNIEAWFEDAMSHASGWYKRKMQVVTLFIGLGVAVAFNADTLEIVHNLSKNPDGAAKIADFAASYVSSHKSPDQGVKNGKDSASVDSLWKKGIAQVKAIDSVNTILGGERINTAINNCFCSVNKEDRVLCILKHLLGWFITAIATTLGAPFWFDLLSKIIQLRGAGAKPEPAKNNPNH